MITFANLLIDRLRRITQTEKKHVIYIVFFLNGNKSKLNRQKQTKLKSVFRLYRLKDFAFLLRKKKHNRNLQFILSKQTNSNLSLIIGKAFVFVFGLGQEELNEC